MGRECENSITFDNNNLNSLPSSGRHRVAKRERSRCSPVPAPSNTSWTWSVNGSRIPKSDTNQIRKSGKTFGRKKGRVIRRNCNCLQALHETVSAINQVQSRIVVSAAEQCLFQVLSLFAGDAWAFLVNGAKGILGILSIADRFCSTAQEFEPGVDQGHSGSDTPLSSYAAIPRVVTCQSLGRWNDSR